WSIYRSSPLHLSNIVFSLVSIGHLRGFTVIEGEVGIYAIRPIFKNTSTAKWIGLPEGSDICKSTELVLKQGVEVISSKFDNPGMKRSKNLCAYAFDNYFLSAGCLLLPLCSGSNPSSPLLSLLQLARSLSKLVYTPNSILKLCYKIVYILQYIRIT
ncbi:hypothetical protein PCH_Pc12g05800, partial [Penicillium rubens Wisconsin 54-1255]